MRIKEDSVSQLDDLLRVMVKNKASDLHIKAMRPPLFRKDGVLQPIKTEPLKPEAIEKTLMRLLKERHVKELEERQAVDVGYSVPGVARFRANIFVQRGTYGAVFRAIPIEIPSLDQWDLPEVLREFTTLNQGLVLVTGPTGSGKSSTLAALIREINETRHCHIITAEDPIEFLFRDDKAAITQREIGMDTPSFQQALRNALRQDPDVIMVGEMRDLHTIETAITASETGHLVFSTLHTNSAAQSIDRILDSFPANQQKQVRMQLSMVLQAIVSLKLVRCKDGGRVAAVEICRNSPVISKMIAENRITDIEEEIPKSVAYYRMQTLNQSLIALIVNGLITKEVAMSASPNQEELDLNLRKIYYSGKTEQEEAMANNADYSKIEELLESKRLYTELQDKFSFEVDSRENRIRELQDEMDEKDQKLQAAFKQMDRLLKEKEQASQEKEKVRELYEKKLSQMRKQFQERLGASRK
jgi:twitching motility protein PilT